MTTMRTRSGWFAKTNLSFDCKLVVIRHVIGCGYFNNTMLDHMNIRINAICVASFELEPGLIQIIAIVNKGETNICSHFRSWSFLIERERERKRKTLIKFLFYKMTFVAEMMLLKNILTILKLDLFNGTNLHLKILIQKNRAAFPS